MAEYTPTTEEIREYVSGGGEARPWLPPTPDEDRVREAAFDRWLEAVKREAVVQVLREEADQFGSGYWPDAIRKEDVQVRLRARAAEYSTTPNPERSEKP